MINILKLDKFYKMSQATAEGHENWYLYRITV
jgi:hypothetical protein